MSTLWSPDESGGSIEPQEDYLERKYPKVPEFTTDPLKWRESADEVIKSIRENYPDAWDKAAEYTTKTMNSRGITGLVGRVKGNVTRMGRVSHKWGDTTALEATTHKQIDSAILQTRKFLETFGQEGYEPVIKCVIGYWDKRLETISSGGSDSDYEIARAETANIWGDITAIIARPIAERRRNDYIIAEKTGIDLRGLLKKKGGG
ncbi:MAG: hypothetical protein V1744_06435 [Candidatus Altiarchaeota archaeon]